MARRPARVARRRRRLAARSGGTPRRARELAETVEDRLRVALVEIAKRRSEVLACRVEVHGREPEPALGRRPRPCAGSAPSSAAPTTRFVASRPPVVTAYRSSKANDSCGSEAATSSARAAAACRVGLRRAGHEQRQQPRRLGRACRPAAACAAAACRVRRRTGREPVPRRRPRAGTSRTAATGTARPGAPPARALAGSSRPSSRRGPSERAALRALRRPSHGTSG